MKVVSLSGGLGNQLFQYVIGLSSQDNLEIEWKLGFASENSYGEPELCSFCLPKNTILSSRADPTRFQIRVHHWLLTIGASRSKIPCFVRWILRISACVILKNYFNKFLMPNIPSSLGFDPRFNSNSGNLLVGYFHSYKWLENDGIRLQLQSLEIKNPSTNLLRLIDVASSSKILIVHIRLGDYEKETSLGILSTTYYRDAIQRAHNLCEFDEIWVFTNDAEKSRSIFPVEWTLKSRWINEVDHSASETLKLMQYGHGYILGNSTFSWWAAMLSKHPNPPIFFPSPWFKIAIPPQDLIPPGWIAVQSDFINLEKGI